MQKNLIDNRSYTVYLNFSHVLKAQKRHTNWQDKGLLHNTPHAVYNNKSLIIFNKIDDFLEFSCEVQTTDRHRTKTMKKVVTSHVDTEQQRLLLIQMTMHLIKRIALMKKKEEDEETKTHEKCQSGTRGCASLRSIHEVAFSPRPQALEK